MKMKIWFDMDGTIADLYGVRGWLPMVEASDTTPYEMAKPLVNMARLARYLNRLQKMGHEIGIISWTSKGGTDIYNGQVALAKMVWLYKHLPSVTWDNIKIVGYGVNKQVVCGSGILFDDEQKNREAWGKGAYMPERIFEVLKKISENA